MKKLFCSILLTLVTAGVFAQAKHTVTKASITFKIKNLGFNTTGNFGTLKADIRFDPANLVASVISASIDVNSINTDNDSRDNHLKSDAFFNAAKYPDITMKSVSFKHKGGNNYTGTFNLSIKDKTGGVEVPFTYAVADNTATFTGSFKIKRSDYDVGGSSMIMSNEVTLLLDVQTSK